MGLKIRDDSDELILNSGSTQQQPPFQYPLTSYAHQHSSHYYNNNNNNSTNNNQAQLNANFAATESRRNFCHQQNQKFTPLQQTPRRQSLHHNYHLQQHQIFQQQHYGEASFSRSNSLPINYNNHDKYNDINMSGYSLPVLEGDLVSSLLESSFNCDPERAATSSVLQCLQQDHQQIQQLQTLKQQQQQPQEVFLKSNQSLRQCPSSSFSSRDFSSNSYPSSGSKRNFVRNSREEFAEKIRLVTQFPHKEKLEGFNFRVSFPSDSPKLVVSNEGEFKRIHSINDSQIAIFFKHSAGPKAKIRFLVVFSNEGESTTPVHPCRNHQRPSHPAHIIEISGVSECYWETHPHPSILVVPCETNGSLMNVKYNIPDADHSETDQCPTYCAQIKFLCRNSCLTRKDLTLICQLENGSDVLARESFLLKVSACPRRDAKSKRTLSEEGLQSVESPKKKRKRNSELEPKILDPKIPKEEKDDYEINDNENEELSHNEDSLVVMATETKRCAFYKTMTSSFQTLHPTDFARESRKFETNWIQFLRNEINDTH